METLIEKRYINKISTDSESGTVKGTAIVFDTPSNVLVTENGVKFIETIKRGAVTEELLQNMDIQMLYNHNPNSPYSILARSNKGKGSLKFSVDDEGVKFEFRAKKKDAGIVESIEAGDLDGCSFAFAVDGNDPSAQTISKRSDGMILRDINTIKLIKDFSIVTEPAYSETSVSLRALEEAVEKLEEIEKQAQQAEQSKETEAEKRNREFAEYYKRMQKKYL